MLEAKMTLVKLSLLVLFTCGVYSKASFFQQQHQIPFYENHHYTSNQNRNHLPFTPNYLHSSNFPFLHGQPSFQSPLSPGFPANSHSAVPSQLTQGLVTHDLGTPLSRTPYNPIFILIGSLMKTSPVSGDVLANSGHREHGLVNYFPGMERDDDMPNTCSFRQYVGQCIRYGECSQKGGRSVNYCNIRDFCCLLFTTCGQSSDGISLYHRNKRYPFADQLGPNCGLEIKKKSSSICYLKVKIHYLNIPVLSSKCDGIHLGISGVPGKEYRPLCGLLSGASYVVDIRSASSVNLHIKSSMPVPLQWLMHTQQISCSVPMTETWPVLDSGVIAGTSSTFPPITIRPTSAPVTLSTTTTSSTLPGTCGVPNRKQKSHIGNRGQLPAYILDSQKKAEDTQEDFGLSSLRKPTQNYPNLFRSSGENPLLETLEWAAPTLNDTLFYQIAGVPNLLTGRITFGKQTEPHEYPWAVVMYSNGRFHCGASLISNKHILTAAHCVQRYQNNPRALRVSLGDWNIDSNSDGPNVEASIGKIVVHPSYNTRTLQNDIAVLTMTKKVTFSRNLSPICLPSSDIPLAGKIVTVSGWGRNENNRLQSILMEHSAVALTTKECDQRWSRYGSLSIVDEMLCMDTQDGDSCKGDSGGPTIMEHPANSGRYTQIGLVSFGSSSCTDKNLPGVYTKVTKYLRWIKRQMVEI